MPLTAPYDGPFPVLQQTPKTFTILKNNKEIVVSIDRVKPAFVNVTKDLPRDTTVGPAVTRDISVPVVPVPAPVSRFGRVLHPPTRLGY